MSASATERSAGRPRLLTQCSGCTEAILAAGGCRRAQWTQGPWPQPSTETQSCSPGSRSSGSYKSCTRRPGMAQLPWSMQPARAHGGLPRAPVGHFAATHSLRSAVCVKSWYVLFHWQPRDAAAKVRAASARSRGGPRPSRGVVASSWLSALYSLPGNTCITGFSATHSTACGRICQTPNNKLAQA